MARPISKWNSPAGFSATLRYIALTLDSRSFGSKVTGVAMMFLLEKNWYVGCSAPHTDGEQILARHTDAELGGEAVVEGDEVAAQLGATSFVEIAGEGLGRSVAHRECVPRRLAARLAVKRGSSFEAQVERAP